MSTLMIGFGGKKKGGGMKPSMPPPEMPGAGKRGGRMPRAPKTSPAMPPTTGEPDADDKAIGPEEVSYSENDLCQTCTHMGDDGNCSRYNFPVSETGHCAAGYEASGDGGPNGDESATDDAYQQ